MILWFDEPGRQHILYLRFGNYEKQMIYYHIKICKVYFSSFCSQTFDALSVLMIARYWVGTVNQQEAQAMFRCQGRRT